LQLWAEFATNYITDVDVPQLYTCAHIFAGGLSQYPEFLAGVFDLQFDFCAGICVVPCH
jgi:hypothetical protein